MKTIFCIFFSFLMFSGEAFATEAQRFVTITELHPVAADRPNSAMHQDLIRVYVESAAWGSTDCRPSAADLKKDDAHLLSILLTAWTTDKPIEIIVESSRKPADDVCQSKRVTYKPF